MGRVFGERQRAGIARLARAGTRLPGVASTVMPTDCPLFRTIPVFLGIPLSTGVAFDFYSGGSYPSRYNGALFFADYSRNCIWEMLNGANGKPNLSTVENFAVDASGPVDLQMSPDGDFSILISMAEPSGASSTVARGTSARSR